MKKIKLGKIKVWFLNHFMKFIYLFISTFFGIIFVAIILNGIHYTCPQFYKWLTYWANQKQIPNLAACQFKKLQRPNFKQMGSYNWYEMEIYLENNSAITSALLYSIHDDIAVQQNKGKIELASTKNEPYVVLWKMDPKTTPSVRLQVKSHLNFKENIKYSYYECPIKMEVFIDE
ncbi:TPA: hypothetical protein ACT9IC_001479 [Legionella pneumophila]